MSNEEKTPLKVKGLGESGVPAVEGLNAGKIDVTSTPTVAEPAPVEKVDVTSTPTVAEPAPVEKVDVTAVPTASSTTAFNAAETPQTTAAKTIDVTAAPTVGQAGQASFDPTAMPTSTGAGNSSNTDWSKYLKIGGIVLGVIVVIIIIVSIAGGKKIVCTEEESYSGMTEKMVTTFKFDGDGKVSSVAVEMTMDYSNASNKPSDSEVETLAKSMIEGKDGAEYKVSNGVLTITYSSSKEEDLKAFKDTTYDKMKEAIEKNDGKFSGYGTCKVK